MISILLVDPENPDNIGAVARAMKNMGFSDLRFVRPPADWRSKSVKMAMSGADLLESARVFSSVEDAIADCHFVLGTTRRGGPNRGFFMPFQKAVETLRERSARGARSAVMFGRESKGLDNDSLSCCHAVTTFPVHPACPSINLAQAVMIMVFKLFEAAAPHADIEQYRATASIPKRGRIRARTRPREGIAKLGEYEFLTQKQVEVAVHAFEQALKALGYETRGDNVIERILVTFRGILKRSGLMASEAQMIKGLSRRIRESTKGFGHGAKK